MAGQGKLVWDEKINLITALWKFHQFNCSPNNIIFAGNIYRLASVKHPLYLIYYMCNHLDVIISHALRISKSL